MDKFIDVLIQRKEFPEINLFQVLFLLCEYLLHLVTRKIKELFKSLSLKYKIACPIVFVDLILLY